ncbi:hypothetical protein [Aliagarivorans taiwanensis]|uniref:hypothetical protein n=1 Tax=Aliagarivorans taiwanensis TaxID=561966 RepID=UPI0004064FA8|nr:hypothetical protein [Aliagarivorans taiwanensis]
MDAQGTVLGERILHHPHVDEQPFTRSLRGVIIPRHLRVVYIEAHDKQHGWSAQKVSVELDHSQRVAKRLP